MKKTILALTTLAALHAAPAAFGAGPDPTATPTPAARTVGMFLNEPEAFEGYTLFSYRFTNRVALLQRAAAGRTIYLIDNQGREVHRWELGSEPCSPSCWRMAIC